MRKTAWMGLAALMIANGAHAQPAADCRAIVDEKNRLACYDAAAAPEPPAKTEPIQKTPEARARYADALRRTFLANGVNMDVFWPEKRDKSEITQVLVDKYPRLTLFGYHNNSTIYQIITEGQVLKNAQALGFRSVEFYGKGGGGGWWFDVSGASLPRCDVNKRLCL